MNERICTRCGLRKPLTDFWIIKGKPHSWCRQCANSYRNAWYRTKDGRDHQHRQALLPAKRYGLAKYAAKKRGIEFTISKEAFSRLILEPCFYCGAKLDTTGNSMDRKDNDLGYIEHNAVPCCWLCNKVKGDTFTFVEMGELGSVIQSIRLIRELKIVKRGGRPASP